MVIEQILPIFLNEFPVTLKEQALLEEKGAISIQLEKTFKDVNVDDILIFFCGDWNVKVGSDNTHWGKLMGPYGIGTINVSGEIFIDFGLIHNLGIGVQHWNIVSTWNQSKGDLDLS